jgi:hypothetical protein
MVAPDGKMRETDVVDGTSCSDGYVETTTPSLTISGSGSDTKGTFTYGACTAN